MSSILTKICIQSNSHQPFQLSKENKHQMSPVVNTIKLEDPEATGVISKMFRIGRGNFGSVYYARHYQTDTVAVKKMLFSPDKKEQFEDIMNEIEFLKTMENEHCVGFRGGYISNEHVWLLMEYCIGSAHDLITVHKQPLSEPEIAILIKDTLSGLEYMHNLNRIHRDIKASNILVTDKGVAKLGDFGTASPVSPASGFVGSPYWIAPDVVLSVDGGHYDHKVDIWSLGITCIELAEGQPPNFNSNTMTAIYRICQNDPPTLKEKEKWSKRFHGFLKSCLQTCPLDRKTAGELKRHKFIVKNAKRQVLVQLVQKTKLDVKNLDDLSRRKMKKLLICDNNTDLDESHTQEHYEAIIEDRLKNENSEVSTAKESPACKTRMGKFFFELKSKIRKRFMGLFKIQAVSKRKSTPEKLKKTEQ